MQSVIYSGSFGGVAGYSGLTATLSAASPVPSGAVIVNVMYSLKITASGYSSSKSWILSQLAVGGSGGSPSASASAGMTGRNYTFSGNMAFSEDDASKFASDTITAYAAAYTTHDTTSYLWDVSIIVYYAFPDKSLPPSLVTINGSASAIESSAATAVLAWSGAEAGEDNAISGYFISCYDSADGEDWRLIEETIKIATDETSGSTTVDLPAVGTRRKFEVKTLSAYGDEYGSEEGTESPAVLRIPATTACGAPTVCTLSSTIATSNVTLEWSGATAGVGNAVTGYEVQRAESVDGVVWAAWEHLNVTTGTSLSVAPPATPGNYYRFRVRTLGAAGTAYYSAWKTCGSTLRRDHAAVEGFTDSPLVAGETPIKAIHMQELQDRVATLRAFYGLSAYGFSTIIAGQTSLAGWTSHVLELRAAIDEIGKEHAAWLAIPENRPRADVLEQLREVVLSL